MKVVLRNTKLGLYYAGHDPWLSNPAEALGFQDAERAAKFARQAKRGDLQAFLFYEGGSGSAAEEAAAYRLGAAACHRKPALSEEFDSVVKRIAELWLLAGNGP